MGLLDWAEEKANSVQSFASGIADRVSSTATAVAGAVGSGIDTAAGAVGSAAQAMGESIGARATSLAQTVSGAASGAAAIAQRATAAVAAQAEARVTALANNVRATATTIAARVGKGAGVVASGVGGLATAIATRVQKAEAGIAATITHEAARMAGNYRRNTGAIADTVTQGAGLWAKLTMGAERAIGSGVLAAAGVAREYGGETGAAAADWAVAREAQAMANAERNTAAVVHWVDATGHAVAGGFANAGDFLAKQVTDTTNLVSTRAQARAGQVAGLVSSGASGIAGLVQTGSGAIANGVGAVASGAAAFANKRIQGVAGMYVRGFGAVGEGIGALAGKAAVAVRDGAAAVGKGIGAEVGDVAAFLKGQAGAIASNVGAGVGYLAGQVGRRAHDLAHGIERSVAFASEQTGVDLDAMATRALVGLESAAQGVRNTYESARTQAEQAALGVLRAAQEAAAPITGPMGATLAKVKSALMERAAQAQAAVQAMTERGRKALSGFALLKSQAIAQAMAAKAKAREIAAQTLAAAKELPILKAAGRAFDFVKGLLHAGGEKVSGGVGYAKDLVSKGIGFVKGIPGMLRPNTDEVETLADGSSRTHTDGEVTGPFIPASFKGTPKEKEWAGKGARAALAGGAALFVNGIKYSYKSHAAAAQRMANELGVVVVGVWNATGAGHGGVGELRDWIQCASDKLNDLGGNPAVATVRGIIEEYGDARKPNGGLRLLAHSQGSIIVSEAMRQAQKGGVDIRNNDVSTFGNAAWTVPDGATYRHFVFAGDAISNSVGSVGIGTGPLGFLSELAGFRSTGRDTRVMEHASWNPIRQHGLNDGVDDGGADYISATSGAIRDDWAKDPRWAGRGGYEAPTSPSAPIPKAPAFTPHMILRGQPLSPLGGGGKTFPNQVKSWMPSLVRSWLGDPDQGARDGGSLAPKGIRKLINSKTLLQREGDGPDPGVDPGALRSSLIREGGGGFAPSAALRERLGGHLGFDPAGARLHTHAAAGNAARAMNAQAFTIGNDVFFAPGRYDPNSAAGQGLLAHELTHVGQQTGAGGGPLQHKGGRSGFGDMERAAQLVGDTIERAYRAPGGVQIDRVEVAVLGAAEPAANRRLDAITDAAVAEATRRLEVQPAPGVRIDELLVDIELDLDEMSDAECIDRWADAIVQAARRHARPARAHAAGLQRKENETGLPDDLKSGVENLSGLSLDGVQVHYNSDRPASLSAHAYAQGIDIHVAPGEERHLPHEAWHVDQQRAFSRAQMGRNFSPAIQFVSSPVGAKPGLPSAVVSSMSTKDKIGKALGYGMGMVPGELADQIKGSIPMMIGGLLLVTGAQFIPGANVALNLAGYALMGWGAFDAIKKTIQFFSTASNAKSDEDLRKAGGIFAGLASGALIALLLSAGKGIKALASLAKGKKLPLADTRIAKMLGKAGGAASGAFKRMTAWKDELALASRTKIKAKLGKPGQWVEGKYNQINSAVTGMKTAAKEKAWSLWGKAKTGASNAFGKAKGIVSETMAKTGGAASKGMGKARQMVGSTFSKTKNAVSDAWESIRAWGKGANEPLLHEHKTDGFDHPAAVSPGHAKAELQPHEEAVLPHQEASLTAHVKPLPPPVRPSVPKVSPEVARSTQGYKRVHLSDEDLADFGKGSRTKGSRKPGPQNLKDGEVLVTRGGVATWRDKKGRIRTEHEIKDGLGRENSPNYNDRMPQPGSVEHTKIVDAVKEARPGWDASKMDWAHGVGQGYGHESPIDLMLAPRSFNQVAENIYIEGFDRALRRNMPDAKVVRTVISTPLDPKHPQLSKVLAGRTYKTDIVSPGGEKFRLSEITLNIGPDGSILRNVRPGSHPSVPGILDSIANDRKLSMPMSQRMKTIDEY